MPGLHADNLLTTGNLQGSHCSHPDNHMNLAISEFAVFFNSFSATAAVLSASQMRLQPTRQNRAAVRTQARLSHYVHLMRYYTAEGCSCRQIHECIHEDHLHRSQLSVVRLLGRLDLYVPSCFGASEPKVLFAMTSQLDLFA